MSKIQRINITLQKKLVQKSIIEKKKIVSKLFNEEKGKGFNTSNLNHEDLIKRIRKSRDELWEEKYNGNRKQAFFKNANF